MFPTAVRHNNASPNCSHSEQTAQTSGDWGQSRGKSCKSRPWFRNVKYCKFPHCQGRSPANPLFNMSKSASALRFRTRRAACLQKRISTVQKRQSIYVDGFAHRNPVPAACRIGNMVYSGGIHGLDPTTGLAAEGMERQCALMFGHVRAIILAAGGAPEDIIKMTLWMKDRSERDLVNPHWTALFPDPGSRPARHALKADLEGGMLIQCDFIAVLGKG